MSRAKPHDAVVIGSGPNGLAAAITLAKAGFSTLVLEQAATPGGGARSQELTLPGFVHDVCAAAFPLAAASPFFRSLPLESYGLKWIHAPSPLAHPLDNGVVLLERSLVETAAALGVDKIAYKSLFQPIVTRSSDFFDEVLGPLAHLPHAFFLARFGLHALRSAEGLARRNFRSPEARALLAGVAAHSGSSLRSLASSSIGLVLMAAAHAHGWPIPQGGAQRISAALVAYFQALGGELRLENRISSWAELPPARCFVFDLTPRQLMSILGDRLASSFRRKLSRFRQGCGVVKMDWALSGPIPWKSPGCRRAATVHLGGSVDEIVASEECAPARRVAERPFVLLCQPSLFDSTRAPPGMHTAWGYCHVPFALSDDHVPEVAARIEAQIERFAPGFRSLILGRSILTPSLLEQHNPNLLGGDISGGATSLRQLIFRPASAFWPYSTSLENGFLCSASVPPGPGVHGMGGYHAATRALQYLRRRR